MKKITFRLLGIAAVGTMLTLFTSFTPRGAAAGEANNLLSFVSIGNCPGDCAPNQDPCCYYPPPIIVEG